MSEILVVAPHPDDETLGCGGTLLRHIAGGDRVHWLIITGISTEAGFTAERVARRGEEIAAVAQRYGFAGVHSLGLPTTRLDTLSLGDIVGQVSKVFTECRPEIVYLPYGGDAHSDHKACFDAVVACTKWFRYPSVKRVLVYETLSETDFGLNPDSNGFRPNVFVGIDDHLDTKIDIMRLYEGEMGDPPFPRSEAAMRALATLRGAAAGCGAAEAFMLLKEII